MSLSRKLGFISTTNIVIANMVGAGIFTTSGIIMVNLNNPILLLLLWLVGGLIVLCGALSYGTLGALMPEAGGDYLFLTRLYHPLVGFLSGWISLIVGFSAPIAASSIGCSDYLIRAFPTETQAILEHTFLTPQLVSKCIAIFIIMSFTILHARGLKTGTLIQNIITVLKLAIIILIIIAAFTSSNGSITHFKAPMPATPPSWQAIGLSLMWILFAYSGWNATTYIGSEVKQPSKTIPLSLITGTAIVIVLYIMLNIVYIYAMEPEKMKHVISVGGLAMGKLFGSEIEQIFSVIIAFALLSSISAFIIIGPRVYYAMAKDHLFFKSFGQSHHQKNVPTKAIALQGALACLYVLTGTFEQILTYIGFSLGIFPIIAVWGIFRLRKKKPNFKAVGYPFIPAIFIITSISILALAFINRPIESTIAIIAITTGIPVYYYFNSRK